MNVEARAQGCELLPSGSMSSYRTYDQQVYLYNEYLAGRGALAAVPGTSNHGWGLAVDLATTDMRSMLDRIGTKYGWSKATSDAQSEWWHIKWVEGSWSGPDPGPEGKGQPIIQPPEGTVAISTLLNHDGRLEVFVEKDDGSVWHAWQQTPGGSFAGSKPGVPAVWYALGTPGK